MSTSHSRAFGRLKFGSGAPVTHGTADVHTGPAAPPIGNIGPVVFHFSAPPPRAKVCGAVLFIAVPLRSMPASGKLAPNGVCWVIPVMGMVPPMALTPPRRLVLPLPH